MAFDFPGVRSTSRRTGTENERRASSITGGVSSVEPLSTTITSSSDEKCCCERCRRHSARSGARLYVAMTTLTGMVLRQWRCQTPMCGQREQPAREGAIAHADRGIEAERPQGAKIDHADHGAFGEYRGQRLRRPCHPDRPDGERRHTRADERCDGDRADEVRHAHVELPARGGREYE